MRVDAAGRCAYVLPPVQPPPAGHRGGNRGGNRGSNPGGGGGRGGGVPGLPGQGFVNAPPPDPSYMSGAAPPAQGVGPAPWLQMHQQKHAVAGPPGEPGGGGGGGGGAPQHTPGELSATLQGYQAAAAARQHARGNRPHASGSALADAKAGEAAGAFYQADAAAAQLSLDARLEAARNAPPPQRATATPLSRAGGAARSFLGGAARAIPGVAAKRSEGAGRTAAPAAVRGKVPAAPKSVAEEGDYLGGRAAERVRARRGDRAAHEQTQS